MAGIDRSVIQMTKKILVMGLPGSGKTTFSQDLVKKLMISRTVKWLNADAVRELYNDWDFSPEGRRRQVERMRGLAEESNADFAICDFVCPTDDLRDAFDADIVIWMDTIKEGRFADTNKLFQRPIDVDYHVTDWGDDWVKSISASLLVPKSESHLRSISKAVSWRIIGTSETFIISWIITGQLGTAGGIAGIQAVASTLLYWFHERIWQRTHWGKS
jgi:adenylylsulfate kinase